jgi:hypothetical protein
MDPGAGTRVDRSVVAAKAVAARIEDANDELDAVQFPFTITSPIVASGFTASRAGS